MKNLLFLCTGNYYRSRFAELLFNARASRLGLAWQADSRGLQLFLDNPGPISRHTIAWLALEGISVPPPIRAPRQVVESDLQAAHLVVAVKEAEHRPMVERNFPDWASRVEFWDVHDLDFAMPHEALPQLARYVDRLADRLLAEVAKSA